MKPATEIAEVSQGLAQRPVSAKAAAEVGRMFLNAREAIVLADERMRGGRRDPLSPVGRDYLSGVRDALAWVLDVDLRQMDVPKAAAGEIEPPKRVTMSWIASYGCWLVEFPPDEMQAKQQERAEFLSQRQAFQLLDELRDHVLGRAMLMAAEYAVNDGSRVRLIRESEPAASRMMRAVPSVRATRSVERSAASGGDDDLPWGA